MEHPFSHGFAGIPYDLVGGLEHVFFHILGIPTDSYCSEG